MVHPTRLLYDLAVLRDNIEETFRPSRERSIALTKLEEAEVWLRIEQDLPKVAELEAYIGELEARIQRFRQRLSEEL